MGDKKPKKTSSGTNDAHKARQAKIEANRPPTPEITTKKRPNK